MPRIPLPSLFSNAAALAPYHNDEVLASERYQTHFASKARPTLMVLALGTALNSRMGAHSVSVVYAVFGSNPFTYHLSNPIGTSFLSFALASLILFSRRQRMAPVRASAFVSASLGGAYLNIWSEARDAIRFGTHFDYTDAALGMGFGVLAALLATTWSYRADKSRADCAGPPRERGTVDSSGQGTWSCGDRYEKDAARPLPETPTHGEAIGRIALYSLPSHLSSPQSGGSTLWNRR